MQFKLKTTIYMFDRWKEFCKAFSVGRGDLIITNGHIYENCLKDFIGEAVIINMRKYGCGEPNDGMVEAIRKDILDITYNRVIAVGGGSILDVAKLFALKDISPVQELFERKLKIVKEKELILLPTTCGTGSEVTNLSILEIKNKKTKFGLAADEIFADYAVLIPELLDTLPFESFAASSIDAFIHAIESYLSPKANPFTEMYSKKAMELILMGYQSVAKEGEQARFSYRKEFLLAGTYAGIAFGNAGCAAVHALSYPLGSLFHIAHGEANYAMFLGVFNKYMKLCPEGKIKALNLFLCELLECEENNVYQEIELLFSRILPKKSLFGYGVTMEQLKEFTESVIKNQGRLLANNYVVLQESDIYEIYQSVY